MSAHVTRARLERALRSAVNALNKKGIFYREFDEARRTFRALHGGKYCSICRARKCKDAEENQK